MCWDMSYELVGFILQGCAAWLVAFPGAVCSFVAFEKTVAGMATHGDDRCNAESEAARSWN